MGLKISNSCVANWCTLARNLEQQNPQNRSLKTTELKDMGSSWVKFCIKNMAYKLDFRFKNMAHTSTYMNVVGMLGVE